MILEDLYTIIEDRKRNRPDKSYVASLFQDSTDRIIQKVGEEATEVVIAAKNRDRKRIVSEVADLWFHTLVLLAAKNISLKEVFTELFKRSKLK